MSVKPRDSTQLSADEAAAIRALYVCVLAYWPRWIAAPIVADHLNVREDTVRLLTAAGMEKP